MTTDIDIIRRSRDNPAIFGQLYDRYAPSIYRYAARRAGDFAAEDVMADTFLVAFERRNTFDLTRADARPWLFGIATNLLRHHHRAEARSMKALMKAKAPADVADISDRLNAQIDASLAYRTVAQTLKDLPAIDRDTILLYAWAELSYEEIAAAMNVPLGTVRSRLNRARKALKQHLNPSRFEEQESDHGRTASTPRNA